MFLLRKAEIFNTGSCVSNLSNSVLNIPRDIFRLATDSVQNIPLP